MTKVATAITCRKCNTRVYLVIAESVLECGCDIARKAKAVKN